MPTPARTRRPSSQPTRRGALALSGLAGLGVLAGLAGCTPAEHEFPPQGTAPLPIPPLAPSRLVDGVRTFTLTAQTGESALIAGRPDVRTPTVGYDGAFLGPTVRMARGERVRVDIRNDLDVVTTLHWHGMHLPAEMDGGPHTPIGPAEKRTVEWEVRQPAATLWYHPHPHGKTEEQVLKGLAGLVLVDDEDAAATGLPHEYGVDDVPLILQDRLLDRDGRIIRSEGDNALGTVGRTLLANGLAGAEFAVTTQDVRLRLLNGSAARFLDLRFADDRPFLLVGTDGGLLESPVELTRLPLSPGERAEVAVRFAADDRVALRTEQPDIPGAGAAAALGDQTAGDLVTFRAAGALAKAHDWSLPADPRAELTAAEAVVTRSFELRMPFLNGREMDMERIDAIVRLNDAELWEVTTPDVFPHNFHVHDVQFRVLDVDGQDPPPWLRGWKDTVPLHPGRPVRLVMRFEDYTSTSVPYMMHCHLLQHEDSGMMGQFLVTEDGTGPRTIAAPPDPGEHSSH
ncbi:MAG TPA: multicopper oxidase domain-containing protein [Brevibacterium senegalense]|uniref:Multicopper oxidase CueO n=1 Tax=Brevibacterium senegalense TaxID=1033736 RepID=A0A921MFN2_9MICO|nr:multicopper oxidase domain-containing protein [Brevibacterium senegalense]